VDGDAEFVSGTSEEAADVVLRAKPQLVAEGEPSGEALSDEQPGAPVAPCDGGGFVEEGARIEDLEYLWVRPADGGDYRGAGSREQPGQLPTSIAVECLQEPPVPACRKRQLVVGQIGGPAAAQHADGKVLVDYDHREPA